MESNEEYATDKMELTIPELEGPNANFFYSYGHPDEHDSFLAQSKLFTVRNAESEENLVCDGEVPLL